MDVFLTLFLAVAVLTVLKWLSLQDFIIHMIYILSWDLLVIHVQRRVSHSIILL